MTVWQRMIISKERVRLKEQIEFCQFMLDKAHRNVVAEGNTYQSQNSVSENLRDKYVKKRDKIKNKLEELNSLFPESE